MPPFPPPKPLPTITLIFDTYKQSPPRPHLGASQIGGECERALWYSFRWCLYPEFDQRMLRLFETGQREEGRVLQNLRDAGIQIWDRDGKSQIQFSAPYGHYSGSVDAIGKGFPESKAPHIIEIKTSNTKGFKALVKSGVQVAKPQHYAQMQQYMSWAKLDRAYYICVCKETDEIYGERIRIDKPYVAILEQKARAVVFSPEPLEKAGESETDFRCRFCDFKPLCWSASLPEINCRTCCHATPQEDGTWQCESSKTDISTKDQFIACDRHIFIPALVQLEAVDADPVAGTVTYASGIINGPGATSSEEMRCSLETTKPQP